MLISSNRKKILLQRRQERIKKGIQCNLIYGSFNAVDGKEFVEKLKVNLDVKVITENFKEE